MSSREAPGVLERPTSRCRRAMGPELENSFFSTHSSYGHRCMLLERSGWGKRGERTRREEVSVDSETARETVAEVAARRAQLEPCGAFRSQIGFGIHTNTTRWRRLDGAAKARKCAGQQRREQREADARSPTSRL